MNQTLSDNIQKLRLAAGLSQVSLARALNVSKQCVSNWENDNVLPSIEMLMKIAGYFRVSTDFLLGKEKDFSLDVSGLTEEQIGHIRLLIQDLSNANK